MYGVESKIESDTEEIMYGEIARREFNRAKEDKPENQNLETAMVAGMIRDKRHRGRFTTVNKREVFCSLRKINEAWRILRGVVNTLALFNYRHLDFGLRTWF